MDQVADQGAGAPDMGIPPDADAPPPDDPIV